VVIVIASLITRSARWKVSLHVGGIAGSATVFVLLFGWILLMLTLLLALLGWARWRVGAHTTAQAVMATVLAVVITVDTFWCKGCARRSGDSCLPSTTRLGTLCS
jgi:hypothetical protein